MNINKTNAIISGVLLVGGVITLRESTKSKSNTGQLVGAVAFVSGLIMLFFVPK